MSVNFWTSSRIASSTKRLQRPRPLDVAMAGAVVLDIAGSIVSARLAFGWITAALVDVVVCGYLLALLTWRAWRPIITRLLLMGLIAGILELATDAAGEFVAHSLVYPVREPTLWVSPAYMPLSWMAVLTPLAYLGWRLAELAPGLPLWGAMLLTGAWSALNIPFYEEMAYAARWWRYTTPLRVGHTPLYVILFEGLIGAALPPLVRGMPAMGPRQVILRGLLLGIWIACAALIAWLLLGWA